MIQGQGHRYVLLNIALIVQVNGKVTGHVLHVAKYIVDGAILRQSKFAWKIL